jgi:predicted nucleotidyltransferase
MGMDLSRPLSTVTPTLDGDVLAVLARSAGPFTTGQLHRMLHDPSEAGIRKVLQRLTKQGIVTATRVGNAFTYQLNRDHLAAKYVAGLAGLQSELLDKLERRIKSWQIKPTYAAVFGSAARGAMTTDSDLDILLIYPTLDSDDWRSQVDDLTTDVASWIGNDVRPLELSESEVGWGYHREVLSEVLLDGLTLIGSTSELRKNMRKNR